MPGVGRGTKAEIARRNRLIPDAAPPCPHGSTRSASAGPEAARIIGGEAGRGTKRREGRTARRQGPKPSANPAVPPVYRLRSIAMARSRVNVTRTRSPACRPSRSRGSLTTRITFNPAAFRYCHRVELRVDALDRHDRRLLLDDVGPPAFPSGRRRVLDVGGSRVRLQLQHGGLDIADGDRVAHAELHQKPTPTGPHRPSGTGSGRRGRSRAASTSRSDRRWPSRPTHA